MESTNKQNDYIYLLHNVRFLVDFNNIFKYIQRNETRRNESICFIISIIIN